jgi:hypothetical protein
LAIALLVLLSSFFWPLRCWSFCLLSFGHCVVGPFVFFLLTVVLFVLLFFLRLPFWYLQTFLRPFRF